MRFYCWLFGHSYVEGVCRCGRIYPWAQEFKRIMGVDHNG